MRPLTEDLANRLRHVREGRFLTQEQMAREVGVSLRTYQEWESSRSFPQVRHRSRLAALLEEAA